MPQKTYRHQVIFDLKWDADAPETALFFEDARRILTAIPGVGDFTVCRQVSPKNDFPYGFTMTFSGTGAFQAYAGHPAHTAFVKDRWETEVTRFLEIDFEDL